MTVVNDSLIVSEYTIPMIHESERRLLIHEYRATAAITTLNEYSMKQTSFIIVSYEHINCTIQGGLDKAVSHILMITRPF